MKTLTLLILSTIPTFAADCVDIVPAKSLGVLSIGQSPPAEKVGVHSIQRDKDSPKWLTAGPYYFHTSKNGKIDSIQYDPGSSPVCYSLNGKKLPSQPNFRALKESFPSCQEEQVFGGWSLECDGMMWLEGEKSNYRVTVRNQTLRQKEEERAGDHVKSIMQNEWPNRAKRK